MNMRSNVQCLLAKVRLSLSGEQPIVRVGATLAVARLTEPSHAA